MNLYVAVLVDESAVLVDESAQSLQFDPVSMYLLYL
jgi:hypothetical protein